MSFDHWLIVISTLISLGGGFAYVRDTIKGSTKPNRVSWGLWALAPLIGTGAALTAGADPWVTIRTFLAGFIPLIVFIASFYSKQGYWKSTIFDRGCGILSFVAFVLWLFADLPIYAILIAAVGDFLAALPTIVKSWKYPETETGITYLTSLVSVLLVLPSIEVWNIQNSAFQIYLIAANILLLGAVYRKKIVKPVLS
jgi:hypothetical protein